MASNPLSFSVLISPFKHQCGSFSTSVAAENVHWRTPELSKSQVRPQLLQWMLSVALHCPTFGKFFGTTIGEATPTRNSRLSLLLRKDGFSASSRSSCCEAKAWAVLPFHPYLVTLRWWMHMFIYLISSQPRPTVICICVLMITSNV